jgi:lipopolysaccharide/colanic/teichoic acid biosynthesis glycosyltransferase
VAKRLFDLVAASVGLLLLSPVFLVVAVAHPAQLAGPGLLPSGARRPSRPPFSMLKFRTMRPDAERVGGQLTVGADPRITPIGHTLRRYKLDELPQLINVVLGDMSLVGPRPEVPRYVALYDDRQRSVLDVRPGITDPASIAYRDENALLANAADPEATYVREVMPAKLEINLAYLERRSLATDVGIILDTLAKLLRR